MQDKLNKKKKNNFLEEQAEESGKEDQSFSTDEHYDDTEETFHELKKEFGDFLDFQTETRSHESKVHQAFIRNKLLSDEENLTKDLQKVINRLNVGRKYKLTDADNNRRYNNDKKHNKNLSSNNTQINTQKNNNSGNIPMSNNVKKHYLNDSITRLDILLQRKEITQEEVDDEDNEILEKIRLHKIRETVLQSSMYKNALQQRIDENKEIMKSSINLNDDDYILSKKKLNINRNLTNNFLRINKVGCTGMINTLPNTPNKIYSTQSCGVKTQSKDDYIIKETTTKTNTNTDKCSDNRRYDNFFSLDQKKLVEKRSLLGTHMFISAQNRINKNKNSIKNGVFVPNGNANTQIIKINDSNKISAISRLRTTRQSKSNVKKQKNNVNISSLFYLAAKNNKKREEDKEEKDRSNAFNIDNYNKEFFIDDIDKAIEHNKTHEI